MDSVLALIPSSVINILMLLILLFLVLNNTIMSVERTYSYILVIILTIMVIIAESSTNMLDLLGSEFSTANIIANIVGFTFSSCIPFFLAVVFDEKLFKVLNFIFLPLVLNFVLIVSSPWTGWIFSVSAENVYLRGPFFGVYILIYLLGLVILMISNYHQSMQFQDAESAFLLMLYAIILIGTTVQIIFPSIHSTWHCVTLVLVMYYLFQRELQFKYDVVTNLLNRQVFKKKLDDLRDADKAGIVILDLDNFKDINDSYGHAKGDYYLKTTAEIIKDSFREIGSSYRIGGDEFCVLAEDADDPHVEHCIHLMIKRLKQARESDPILPYISYGYSIYRKNKERNISLALQEADEKMYICKNSRRNNNQLKS